MIKFIKTFFLFDSFKLLLESLFNPKGLSFSKKFILVKGFMGLYLIIHSFLLMIYFL